jgi:hypothetical protein
MDLYFLGGGWKYMNRGANFPIFLSSLSMAREGKKKEIK